MPNKYNISISAASFFKIVFLLLIVFLAYIVWDILVLLLIAIMLSFLIDPAADWAQKRKIPRGVTVILIYLATIGVFSGLMALLVPALIEQFNNLSLNFGSYWSTFVSKAQSLKLLGLQYGVWDNLTQSFSSGLASSFSTAQKLFSSVVDFFGNIASLVLVLVITFYLVAEEENFKNILHNFTPVAHRADVEAIWERIKEKLGRWLRAQLLLDLVVGVLTYVGLLIIDVQYALLLGLLVGVFETIPYAGPIFAALAGVLLTFMQTGSWVMPALVAVVFFIVQQLESQLLVPKIMQKTAGINPIVSILSLLIGYRLFGVVGALLAIPSAAVITLLWAELASRKFNK